MHIASVCSIFASENQSYLGEFEAEFKQASARKSGAQGLKILWHCHFNALNRYQLQNILRPLTILYVNF
jgi:hypothetical protein